MSFKLGWILQNKIKRREILKNRPLRVQVCNLNLEVYVFLGVVTVQLGIVCSNYKVQVATLNPPNVGWTGYLIDLYSNEDILCL